jgi:triosephosphate isomerase
MVTAPPNTQRDKESMVQQGLAIRPLVAGNWKMNGLEASVPEAVAVRDALAGDLRNLNADVMIAPPATLLARLSAALGSSRLLLAGQDCHAKASGAHTGDVSPEMLKEAGASAVILGHSERRGDHGETSRDVRAKAEGALRAGIAAIICIGETHGERVAGLTVDVVLRQLKESLPKAANAANTVIAYEPVWAIGTGLTPTPSDVEAVHAAIRRGLVSLLGEEGARIRILYGGSVKPQNAVELMAVPEVNGALVGGASLKASDFLAIVRAYKGS